MDDVSTLKSKSITGISALFVRQIMVKVLFFLGNVVLARILVPEAFGIYAIVSFITQFFSIFGDIGLGAALIRKKEELNQRELSTTFWAQQVLVLIVVVIVVLTAPLALRLYPELPESGIWLIRAMAISLMFASLKTVPAIILEKNLDFNKIAWVDITENIAFQATAIIFALNGYEVWSFVLAAVLRGLVGAGMMYILMPWRPQFNFSYTTVKGLVNFGLPYQMNIILSSLKDAVTPFFIGTYVGAAAVGYINWARNLAFAPLMLSDSFGRVAFPAFSKLQTDKVYLSKAIEKSMMHMTLLMFPLTLLMMALAPEIIHTVFTDKWLPGIWAFYLYCTSPLILGFTLPMYSAILSLGKSKVLLQMTLLLLVLEWGLGVPFVLKFGFTGIALNQPIVSGIYLLIYKRVLQAEDINLKIFDHIKWQLLAAVTTALIVIWVKGFFEVGLVTVLFMFIFGTMVYITILYLLRKSLLIEVKNFIQAYRHRG